MEQDKPRHLSLVEPLGGSDRSRIGSDESVMKYGRAASLRIVDGINPEHIPEPLLLDISVKSPNRANLLRQRKFGRIDLENTKVRLTNDLRDFIEGRALGRDITFELDPSETYLVSVKFRVFDSNVESHQLLATFSEQVAAILEGSVVDVEIETKELPAAPPKESH